MFCPVCQGDDWITSRDAELNALRRDRGVGGEVAGYEDFDENAGASSWADMWAHAPAAIANAREAREKNPIASAAVEAASGGNQGMTTPAFDPSFPCTGWALLSARPRTTPPSTPRARSACPTMNRSPTAWRCLRAMRRPWCGSTSPTDRGVEFRAPGTRRRRLRLLARCCHPQLRGGGCSSTSVILIFA